MTARKQVLAADRAAIVLKLVPYLIGKGEVSVGEAAQEFEVDPETMRDMVRKLTLIGIPGDSGYDYMPQDMFDIDWDLLDEQDRVVITNHVALERAPKLTAREAAALLAGLRVAQAIPGIADSEVMAGLVAKLSRGAATQPAEVVVAPGPVDVVQQTVAEALRSGVAVDFTYLAQNAEPTTRTVDPVKVLLANGQWYLQGWCHLREGMRTFNLERVDAVRLTDIPITHADELVPDLFEPNEGDLVVTVRFSRATGPLLGEYLDRAETAEHGDVVVAKLRVADAHSLKRLAVRRGGAVEIVDPPPARQAAAQWAAAGRAQYPSATA
jgi:proteasome accessory factor C